MTTSTSRPSGNTPGVTAEEPRSWPAVWVLGLGTFLFVTTELLPIGLLPSIGDGVGVSISVAGLLVSLYGGIAAVTAAPLTALLGRVDRRWLLAGLLVVLIIGNIMSALAPTYTVLLLSRMVIAFAHGVFWSTTPAAGMRLVATKDGVRALSVVLGGISVASVVGVPLGTALGQATNWRAAFLVMAGLGVITLVAVLVLLPSLPSRNGGSLAAIPGLLRDRVFRIAIVVAALAMSGHYLAYTYLTPYLEEVVGIAPALVSVLLLVFGAAGIAGNFIAGSAVARNLRWSLLGGVGILAASLLALSLGARSPVLAVVLLVSWGLSYAALPVCLQTWVLRSAPHATDAASSVYVAVFNASIALGALTGGIALEWWGIAAITWVGAVLVALAFAAVAAFSRTTISTGNR